jgi:hypothetical protein
VGISGALTAGPRLWLQSVYLLEGFPVWGSLILVIDVSLVVLTVCFSLKLIVQVGLVDGLLYPPPVGSWTDVRGRHLTSSFVRAY